MYKRLIHLLPFMILLAGMIYSLFLPFYATPSDGFADTGFFVLDIFQDGKKEYFTVYNGFHAVFAWVNLMTCFTMTILLFVKKKGKRRFVIWSCSVAAITQLLIQPFFAGLVLSEPDKLMSGYKLLSACEILLLIWAFYSTPGKWFSDNDRFQILQ